MYKEFSPAAVARRVAAMVETRESLINSGAVGSFAGLAVAAVVRRLCVRQPGPFFRPGFEIIPAPFVLFVRRSLAGPPGAV